MSSPAWAPTSLGGSGSARIELPPRGSAAARSPGEPPTEGPYLGEPLTADPLGGSLRIDLVLGSTVTTPTPGFAVLYRWRLRDGSEDSFLQAWEAVTRMIRSERGGLGSRLHRGEDGLWTAYAQWPDRETWQRSQALGPGEAAEAAAAMRAAIEHAEEPLLLEPVRDLFVGVE